MAYKKAELEKKALDVIRKNRYLFCIEDIVSLMPCVKSTFYSYDLHKSDAIKEAIEQNKINVKAGLKTYWNKNHNPTTDIALYKLASTDEELNILTSQKTNVDHSGKIIIDFTTDD